MLCRSRDCPSMAASVIKSICSGLYYLCTNCLTRRPSIHRCRRRHLATCGGLGARLHLAIRRRLAAILVFVPVGGAITLSD